MKTLFKQLYLNPFVRVIGFLLLATLVWMEWDSFIQNRGVSHVPVTLLPKAMKSHLAFSPKGDRIAGCADDGRLYVAETKLSGGDPVIGSPRPLPLADHAMCASFVWNPDGSRILMPFITGDENEAAQGFIDIRVSNQPSSNLLLMRGGVDPFVRPAWSPDGESVAYVAGLRTPTDGGLWIFDIKTLKRRRLRLGVAQSPAFSAKGDRVYFAEDTALAPHAAYDKQMDDWPHVWSVASVSTKDGSITRLAEWTQGSLMPSNSDLLAPLPDGVRYLRYFRNVKGGRVEVWDQRGGKSELSQTLKLEKGLIFSDARWDAKGERLAYLSYPTATGPNRMSITDIDAKTNSALMPGSGAPNVLSGADDFVGYHWSQPCLSPDGAWGANTFGSISQEPEDDSHDEDEGPQFKLNAEKAQPLLLKLN